MTDQEDLPPPARPTAPLAAAAGSLWKALNSAFVIAVVSSVAVLLLSKCYEASQSRSTDLVKRRSDLERLMVELELRKDRLWVVCNQGLVGLQQYDKQQLADIGQRAKAIVGGRSNTVTSDPAYQNFHLATLLNQAEMTAGLSPTQQPILMSFTDLTDEGALSATREVFDEIRDPIETLELELNNGEIPISQTEHQTRNTAATVASSLDPIAAADRNLPKLSCNDSAATLLLRK